MKQFTSFLCEMGGTEFPYTTPQYTQLLLDAEVQFSIDGKRRALDNNLTERLWRTVTYAEVYLREYGAPREARYWLSRYLTHYNEQRPHSSHDYQTPAAVSCETERPSPA